MAWVWDAASNDYYWQEPEQKQPKAPSPYSQLGMILAAQGALSGGQWAGNKIFGSDSSPGIFSGLFGGGSSAVPATPELISAGGAAIPEALSVPTAEAATGGLGLGSIASIAPYAGVAAGGALLAKGASDLLKGKETKGLDGYGGRATLGIATGGISEIARALGLGQHKSTRDIAQGHTSDLLGQHQDDQGYQDYVSGMREQYNSGPPDPSKPFAGKYGSWDEYKNAGLEAGDLTGVYGNINTFGNDWTKIDQKQREAITQALIDADLYQSKKGEVEITDPNKAKEIYASKLAEILSK